MYWSADLGVTTEKQAQWNSLFIGFSLILTKIITISHKITYAVDLNVNFSLNLDRTALRAKPNGGCWAELTAQRVLVCQISATKQLFRGGEVGRERLEHTFEASLGVITMSLSSCVIGDAHFRAPASNSRSYALLTFKCVSPCDHGKKEICYMCRRRSQYLKIHSVLAFFCGNVNKTTCRG